MVYRNLSIIYYQLDKYIDAFKMNEIARKTVLEYLSPNDNQLISLYNDFGELYFINYDYDTALDKYKEALEIDLKILSVDDKELISVYENLYQLYSNNLIRISTDYLSERKCFTSLTHNTIRTIFNKMNNYENACHVELRMSSPNLEYIKMYKNNISRMKNKVSCFTKENFMQLIYAMYEHLFNDG
ncbi:unnamed protein product [Rotaria sp. Silwood2]|nr:unnamed protein product [Rotaria sp. Silwood2]CAF4353816.1 unnamed protein product [Rotaria sp. Silwood2]CAF4461173.1 unnamed protein product [Rotaria sp. Silwood2]